MNLLARCRRLVSPSGCVLLLAASALVLAMVERGWAAGASPAERLAVIATCQQGGTCGTVAGHCDPTFSGTDASCKQLDACPFETLPEFPRQGCFQRDPSNTDFNDPEQCAVCGDNGELCEDDTQCTLPDTCGLQAVECREKSCPDCFPIDNETTSLGCPNGTGCGVFANRTIVGRLVLTATDPAFCSVDGVACTSTTDCKDNGCTPDFTCAVNGANCETSPCNQNICVPRDSSSSEEVCTADNSQCDDDDDCFENFCSGGFCTRQNFVTCSDSEPCIKNECGPSAEVATLRMFFEGKDGNGVVVPSDTFATVAQFPQMKKVECDDDVFDRQSFGCSTSDTGIFHENTLLSGGSILGEIVPGVGAVIEATAPEKVDNHNSLAPSTVSYCVKIYQNVGGLPALFYAVPGAAVVEAGTRVLAFDQPVPSPSASPRPQPSPGCVGADCCAPACGDGIADPGEECDGTSGTVCTGSCIVPGLPDQCTCTVCGNGIIDIGETCDDGNRVEGCRVDKPQKPKDDCNNRCTRDICKDPSSITLAGRGDTNDRVRVHNRIAMPQGAAIPRGSSGLTLKLSEPSSGQTVFEAHTDGPLDASQRTYRFRNRNAKRGAGIARVIIRSRGEDSYEAHIEAYGRLSGPTSMMTMHIIIDHQEWTVTGAWTRTARGWRFVQ